MCVGAAGDKVDDVGGWVNDETKTKKIFAENLNRREKVFPIFPIFYFFFIFTHKREWMDHAKNRTVWSGWLGGWSIDMMCVEYKV